VRIGVLAHRSISGPAPFVAVVLFLVGITALLGAGALWKRSSDRPRRRVGVIAMGVVGVGCLVVATFLPFLLGARPSLGRPSSSARLQVVSPSPGQVFHGDPATIHVVLLHTGGRVVPSTSLRLVPDEGYIHLFLDGTLVSMTTTLTADVAAAPGTHEMAAEFVAVDHVSFDPQVTASTMFSVTP
jgi:hypothetical protein